MTPKPLLLVTKNLPPDTGGMERLWQEAVEHMSCSRDLVVIGPRRARNHLSPHCTFYGAPNSLALFFILGPVLTLLAIIRHRPDTAIAGSGVTAPIVWLGSLPSRTRTLCYLHGLDIIYPSLIYRVVFLPLIRACDLIVVNSENTARVARSRGINAEKIEIITPGVSTPAVRKAAVSGGMDEKLGPGRKHLIFWGRIVERKGLAPFIEKSLSALKDMDARIHLNIVGEAPNQAKHKLITGNIKAISRENDLENDITFWGRLGESDLQALLLRMDVHIFPLLDIDGDIEGFGMVALEAAAAGLQTVAFDCGGVRDAICEEASGYLVKPGDYNALNNAILQALKEKEDRKAACREYATANSWERFAGKLLKYADNVVATK